MPKKKVTIAELTIMEKPHEERLTIVGGSAGLHSSPDAATAAPAHSKQAALDNSEGDGQLEDDSVSDDAGSLDADPQRFRMVGYTGATVSRWYGDLIIDLSGMSNTGLPLPALLSHKADKVSGVIESFDIADDGLVEEGFFVDTEAGNQVVSEMEQKVPYKASIGVQCIKAAWLDDELTLDINGREIEGPCEVWLESEVYETSFTVIPADSNTSVDILSAHNHIQEATMPKSADGKPVKQDADQAALDNASGSQGVPVHDPAQPDTVGLSADDVLSLAAQGQRLGLSLEDVKDLANDCKTPEALGNAMLNKAAELAPSVSTGVTISMGADASERFNNAVTDGMLMSGGYNFGSDKPAEGATDFRRMGLQQILRECLNVMGDRQAFRYTPAQLAQAVIGMSSRLGANGSELLNGGAASTGDFSFILGAVLQRRLMAAYEETPSTWQAWVNIETVKDFRDVFGVSLSEAPDLLPVKENGEYSESYLKDKQESYAVSKAGRILSLTFEMIVNDDTRAFSRIPKIMGAAASRLESDMVYHKLLSNPTMNEDGKELFHADHKNLLTGADISSEAMDLAYEQMMMQRGFNKEAGQWPKWRNAESGALINVIPKYLLVPPALKSKAQVLVRSMSKPESNNSGVVNVYQDDLEPIVEPRLQAQGLGGSNKNWFLAGDSNQIDTIEAGYLEGFETPLTTTYEPFERDAVSWKLRHIFGVGAMDFRGLSKNPGPTG